MTNYELFLEIMYPNDGNGTYYDMLNEKLTLWTLDKSITLDLSRLTSEDIDKCIVKEGGE